MTHFHKSTMDWQWLSSLGRDKWCEFPTQHSIIWHCWGLSEQFLTHKEALAESNAMLGLEVEWTSETIMKICLLPRDESLGVVKLAGVGQGREVHHSRRRVEGSRRCLLSRPLSIKTRIPLAEEKALEGEEFLKERTQPRCHSELAMPMGSTWPIRIYSRHYFSSRCTADFCNNFP